MEFLPCRENRFSKQPSLDCVVSTTVRVWVPCGEEGFVHLGVGNGGGLTVNSCLCGELREGFARWPAGWLAVVKWGQWVPLNKSGQMCGSEIWAGLSWVILLFFVALTEVIWWY